MLSSQTHAPVTYTPIYTLPKSPINYEANNNEPTAQLEGREIKEIPKDEIDQLLNQEIAQAYKDGKVSKIQFKLAILGTMLSIAAVVVMLVLAIVLFPGFGLAAICLLTFALFPFATATACEIVMGVGVHDANKCFKKCRELQPLLGDEHFHQYVRENADVLEAPKGFLLISKAYSALKTYQYCLKKQKMINNTSWGKEHLEALSKHFASLKALQAAKVQK